MRTTAESVERLDRAIKAEKEAAEWKRRFDELLAKLSVSVGAPAPSDNDAGARTAYFARQGPGGGHGVGQLGDGGDPAADRDVRATKPANSKRRVRSNTVTLP